MGLKVSTGCGVPKITIGITGFVLGRGDGIEEPYWGSPNCMNWFAGQVSDKLALYTEGSTQDNKPIESVVYCFYKITLSFL